MAALGGPGIVILGYQRYPSHHPTFSLGCVCGGALLSFLRVGGFKLVGKRPDRGLVRDVLPSSKTQGGSRKHPTLNTVFNLMTQGLRNSPHPNSADP